MWEIALRRMAAAMVGLIVSSCTQNNIGQPPALPSPGGAGTSSALPIAQVGASQRALEGQTVILDGRASRDGEGGTNLSYRWTGPLALSAADESIASFVAPQVDIFETYVFTLTVTDSQGAISSPAQVAVEVSDDPDRLKFVWPIGGQRGADYAVGSYFDLEPAEGERRDHAGGMRVFDGQVSTVEVRLGTYRKRDQGVDVFAAAPGVVAFAEDRIPDDAAGQEESACGNGGFDRNMVVILHAGGWATRYETFMQNSVQVEVGDRVDSGTLIGQIGSSFCGFPFPNMGITFSRCDDVNGFTSGLVDPFGVPYPPYLTCSGQFERKDIYTAGLWADDGPREVPSYDAPASLLDFIIKAGSFDSADPFRDIAEASLQIASSIPLGGVAGIGALVADGMSGERLNFRVTTPTQQVLLFTPDANIGGTADFPFSPQIWFKDVSVNETGTWMIDVLINDAIVGSRTFTVSGG